MAKRKNKKKKNNLLSKLIIDDETFEDEEVYDEQTKEIEKVETKRPVETSSTTNDDLKEISSEELKEFINEGSEQTYGLNVLDIHKTSDSNQRVDANDSIQSQSKYKESDDFEETAQYEGFDDSLYKQNRFSNKKFNGTTIGLLIAIGVLIIGIIIALIFYTGASKKQVVVENFVGSNEGDVKSWCEKHKLDETRCIIQLEFSETVEERQVISQTISSGEKLTNKSMITFIVSQGKDPDYEVELPDFSKMHEEEIHAFFKENEFTNVTYEYEVNPKEEDGKFISINIEGNKAKRSDAIVILISIKEANDAMEVEVPDFKEYTKANIQAWAAQYRISVTFKEEHSDTVAAGKFISQSIKAGEIIKPGDKLTITLSKGKSITMDDFSGKSQKEVQSWCNTNAIKCSFTDTMYSKIAKGSIASQSVKKGTTVSAKSSIKFTLSLGETVDIGNYKDQEYKTFEARIQALNKLGANLTIGKENVTTNKKELADKVISNDASIKMGSKINVKVNIYEPASVEVPKCEGTVESYEKSLKDVGLKPSRSGNKYSSVAKGKVMSCSMNSGKVNEGTTISYYVSDGTYSPSADSFNGKSEADVNNTLKAANDKGAGGWKAVFNRVYDNNIASGTTFGCSINANTVTCSLSKGKQPTVGDYVGKVTWKSNSDKMTVNGVILKNIGAEYHDTYAYGVIIYQSKAYGEPINDGEIIEVKYSLGPTAPELKAGTKLEGCDLSNDTCTKGKYTIYLTKVNNDKEVGTIIENGSCDVSKFSCKVTVSIGPKIVEVALTKSWFTSGTYPTKEEAENVFSGLPIKVTFNHTTSETPDAYRIKSFRVADYYYDGSSCPGKEVNSGLTCILDVNASATATVEIRK